MLREVVKKLNNFFLFSVIVSVFAVLAFFYAWELIAILVAAMVMVTFFESTSFFPKAKSTLRKIF